APRLRGHRPRGASGPRDHAGTRRQRVILAPLGPRPAGGRGTSRRMADAVSRQLLARAVAVIPGGVNSPVRAFRAVGGEPVFIRRASGCWIEGADGTRYIDYVGSWGPMLLGHAHPAVVSAITHAAADGTSFGAPTEREVLLAE